MSGTPIFPMNILERCIGVKVCIIMESEKEFIGTLRGFDQFYRKNNLLTIYRYGFR